MISKGSKETKNITWGYEMKTKLLFICAQNINRSKTAEHLFKDRYETKSTGLYNLSPVTREQLEWADIVIVMEPAHREEISLLHPDMYLKKKIIILDIPDNYRYMQPELIELLEKKMTALEPNITKYLKSGEFPNSHKR